MSSIASRSPHCLALLAGVMNVYTGVEAGALSREIEAAESLRLYVGELKKALVYADSDDATHHL